MASSPSTSPRLLKRSLNQEEFSNKRLSLMNVEDDNEFKNADPKKWVTKEQKFTGEFAGNAKSEKRQKKRETPWTAANQSSYAMGESVPC